MNDCDWNLKYVHSIRSDLCSLNLVASMTDHWILYLL